MTSVEASTTWANTMGPVVVVTDANTYSSGDLFTAGIVDNRIGAVVCVGEATGAGGANVWTSEDLEAAMRAAGHPFPLPKGVSFMVAVRRAVRSGDADGVLIEDAGITGQPYAMYSPGHLSPQPGLDRALRRDPGRPASDPAPRGAGALAHWRSTPPNSTGSTSRGRPSRRPVGAPSCPRFQAAAGAPREPGTSRSWDSQGAWCANGDDCK